MTPANILAVDFHRIIILEDIRLRRNHITLKATAFFHLVLSDAVLTVNTYVSFAALLSKG